MNDDAVNDDAVNDDAVNDNAVNDNAVSGDPVGGPEERRALFRVVRGGPTDAELAALMVVLAAATAARQEVSEVPVRSAWNDPAARLRRPLATGPGAWRTSTWPR